MEKIKFHPQLWKRLNEMKLQFSAWRISFSLLAKNDSQTFTYNLINLENVRMKYSFPGW